LTRPCDIADTGNHRVRRRVAPSGVITTASLPADVNTAITPEPVDLAPLAGAQPCNGKVYDFRTGVAARPPGIVTGAGPGAARTFKVFDGVTGQAVRNFFAYQCELARGPRFHGGVSVAGSP
jgi:hypothetical protein